MDSMIGRGYAISGKTIPFRRATFPRKQSARRTSMIMASGAKFRPMVRCGFRQSRPGGRRTVMVTGYGLTRGDGPGWTTPRGALRPFTTADGRTSAATGDGSRVHTMRVLSGRPRWWRGLVAQVGASHSGSDLAADSAGAHWA